MRKLLHSLLAVLFALSPFTSIEAQSPPGGYSTTGAVPGYVVGAAFGGASLDVNFNSCVAAAIILSTGCDMHTFGGNYTFTDTLNWGNSSFAPVAILLPNNATWTCNITNGHPCVNHYAQAYVRADSPGGIGSNFIIQVSSGAASYQYLYQTIGNGGTSAGYFYAEGIKFSNVGVASTSNIGCFFNGPVTDFSTWKNFTCADSFSSFAAEITGVCCLATFDNFTASGRSQAGVTPLFISSPGGGVRDWPLVFRGLVANNPGTGLPNIKCTDTLNQNSGFIVYGLYEETTFGSATTLNQFDGCGLIAVSMANISVRAAGSTAAMFSMTNNGNGMIVLDSIQVLENGAQTVVPVLLNSNGRSCPVATCTINSDAKGFLARTQTEALCSSSASPAVCGNAQKGTVNIAAAASTIVVNTTSAPNDISQIQLLFDATTQAGTRLAVTCNTTAQQPYVSAITPGTSFTIAVPANFTTNPGCIDFRITK